MTYTYPARIWELVPGGSFFQGRYRPLHSKSEPRDLSSQKRKKLCLKAPSSIPFQMAFAYQLCHYAYLTERLIPKWNDAGSGGLVLLALLEAEAG